ncbi:MAG TPA: peptide ligase PGM1-related protein [Dongiaceae bacterium]
MIATLESPTIPRASIGRPRLPQIVVGNVDNENMMADASGLTPEFCAGSALIAQRMLWFAEPGDIVLLPSPPSAAMMQYVAGWKRCDAQEIRTLSPDPGNHGPLPLGAQNLLEPRFIRQLRSLMGTRRDWVMAPYLCDRSVVALAQELGLPPTALLTPFAQEGGCEMLNDKRTFRGLAAGRGIPLAEGEIVTSRDELDRAVSRLIGKTNAVIIKQDRHSGAEGNLVLSRLRSIGGEGALEAIYADDEAALRKAAAAIWERLAYYERAGLVVEVYFPASISLYAEFAVDSRRRAVDLLNWGEQRMEPVFTGFVIPPALPAFQGARFISGATELARIACDLGMTGRLSVDGIITPDGELVFNEINGRIGGCSQIHQIAELLLGPGYGDNAVIATHHKVPAPLFDEVIDIARAEGLHFDHAERRGIVVMAEDTRQLGVLDFLAIAPRKDEALRIEGKFESLIRRRATHLS